jgi:PTS system nitrogen regulatory IIA component
MNVRSILSPSSIRCESRVTSKKHALDVLSQLLADAAHGPSQGEVMIGLCGRERLGSTGLGQSIAVPHTSLPGIKSKVAALLKLEEPVDFGSPDGQPVDLLFGLLVPEGSAATESREIDVLVDKLRDPELRKELRASSDPKELYSLFSGL